MSTGDLGRSKSSQQIGDITFSYNKTTAAGNALLETNGAMLDTKKYPLLAAKLDKSLEPSQLKQVHSVKARSIAQSDDAEYCFYSADDKLYRYKKSIDATTAVLTTSSPLVSSVTCSASGQYVLAIFFYHNSRKTDIYYSSNYGDSFSLVQSFPVFESASSFHSVFVSRDGRHMLAVRRIYYSNCSFAISHDFGATWSQHSQSVSNHVAEFHTCTQDLVKMYLIRSGGLFVSSDYGKTLVPSTMGLPERISQFRIDPLDNDIMVADSVNHGELLLSTDGGGSWKQIIDPQLHNVSRLQVFNGIITAICSDDNNIYHLMTSHDSGDTWHQSEILGGKLAHTDARMTKGSTNYFSLSNGLYSSKIEDVTRLPLGNLNSERIIADKVV